MTDSPTLSVIIPVYNAEKTLERCLESIRQQTYDDYEIVLINDGSKDRSAKICEDFVKKDQRFKVHHTENHGVSAARNKGLDQISGKYVMFIDSDDYIHADYFQTYVKHINKSQIDIVFGGMIRKQENTKEINKVPIIGIIGYEIWNTICYDPEIFGYVWGKLFRLSIIEENNLRFNETMFSQEDLDFNLSVYEHSQGFEIMDYAGYEYEYAPGKRKPPIWDFIGNSLKMYRIGLSKIPLSSKAKEAIKNRIVNQIFSYLYLCTTEDDSAFAIQKIRNVNGLIDFLYEQEISGEKRMIIHWFLEGKNKRIYRYFTARKSLKKLLRRPVSE